MNHLQAQLELQQVLTARVFPHLPVHTLGALACSSRALHDLVYDKAAEHLWREAAARHLPCFHPSVSHLDRWGIQQVMQRRSTAVINLERGAGIQLTAGQAKVTSETHIKVQVFALV